MKLIINLHDLFTEGFFGPVKIGMTISQVEQIMGKPSGVGEISNMGFIDYFYGFYEIFFHNNVNESGISTVTAFQNDSLQYQNAFDFENEKIKVIPWILKHGITYETLLTKLQGENLEYKIERKNELLLIEFVNQSSISFCNSSKGYLLHSIDYFPDL